MLSRQGATFPHPGPKHQKGAFPMTISSSLSAGVAGLNANAYRLASISDNIANSGTYGYKRASTDFTSMVITSARGSGTYSAGGVRASTIRLIEERGDLVGTGNALDIACLLYTSPSPRD